MNKLPDELIAVPRYHGYFWNPKEQVLYSIKVGGVLRALTLSYSFYIRGHHRVESGFSVSRNGKKN